MKIHGMKVEPPKPITIPIPRINEKGEEYFIEIRIAPVLDFTEFEKICPPVEPKMKTDPSGVSTPVFDAEYKKDMSARIMLQVSWMAIKSLEATEGLEWETVKMDDPSTWEKYPEEMRESGFSYTEISHLVDQITSLSGVNTHNMDEARKRFLALKQAQKPSE